MRYSKIFFSLLVLSQITSANDESSVCKSILSEESGWRVSFTSNMSEAMPYFTNGESFCLLGKDLSLEELQGYRFYAFNESRVNGQPTGDIYDIKIDSQTKFRSLMFDSHYGAQFPSLRVYRPNGTLVGAYGTQSLYWWGHRYNAEENLPREYSDYFNSLEFNDPSCMSNIELENKGIDLTGVKVEGACIHNSSQPGRIVLLGKKGQEIRYILSEEIQALGYSQGLLKDQLLNAVSFKGILENDQEISIEDRSKYLAAYENKDSNVLIPYARKSRISGRYYVSRTLYRLNESDHSLETHSEISERGELDYSLYATFELPGKYISSPASFYHSNFIIVNGKKRDYIDLIVENLNLKDSMEINILEKNFRLVFAKWYSPRPDENVYTFIIK